VAQWVGLSSCAVNPVVYCLFSAKFRDGFRRLLVTEPCCGCRAQAATPAGLRRWSAGVTTDHLVTSVVERRPNAAAAAAGAAVRTSHRNVTVALQMTAMRASCL